MYMIKIHPNVGPAAYALTTLPDGRTAHAQYATEEEARAGAAVIGALNPKARLEILSRDPGTRTVACPATGLLADAEWSLSVRRYVCPTCGDAPGHVAV